MPNPKLINDVAVLIQASIVLIIGKACSVERELGSCIGLDCRFMSHERTAIRKN